MRTPRLLSLLLVALLAADCPAAAPPVPFSPQQTAMWQQRNQLLQQAITLSRAGKTDETIAAIQKALTLERAIVGGLRGNGQDWLDELARLQLEREQFAAAIASCRELLALRKQWYGPDHWHVTDALLALRHAQLLMRLEAPQRQRVRQADTWNKQVVQLWKQGRSNAALPLAQKALAIRSEILGEKDRDTAQSWMNLGAQHAALTDFPEAMRCYTRALNLFKDVLGETHPDFASNLNNLALLHKNMGEYAKALPLYLQARDLRRKTLGEKHPVYASSLNNLALLYQEMGEPGKALPLLVEARELYRGELGEKHPDYVNSLSNLGMLYRAKGEHSRALPLLLQARQLRREVQGEKHPLYTTSLSNLALLYRDMGEHGKALPLLLEVRERSRKLFGEKHPRYATSLNNLATFYLDMGEYQKALPLLVESREVCRASLSEKHPHQATVLKNLAAVYQWTGKPDKALELAREALQVLDTYLEDSFDHLGDLQRAEVTQKVLFTLGFVLSLQDQTDQPAAQRYAAVLSWKGRVAARGSLDRLLRDQPKLKEPLQRLQTVRGRLAHLGLQTPQPRQHAAWLNQLQSLTEEKQRLEADLALRSADVRHHQSLAKLTPAHLSKQIPAGVAFVDLLQYDHYSPPKAGKGKPVHETRLLAFVVLAGKEPIQVHLGAIKPIADAVESWRAAVEQHPARAGRLAIDSAGQTLRQRLWLPLSRHLGEAKTVLVAPDGILCQFPLAALPGSKPGTWLIEEVAIASLASAHQLAALLQPVDQPRAKRRGLLAVGGADYGLGKGFPPLPGTALEAQRCRTLYRLAFPENTSITLTGKAATVQAVQQTLKEKRPAFLHLATHGFFEPPDRVERLLRGLAAREDGLTLGREQTLILQSLPLLRCGLALAGANQAIPSEDNRLLRGILTGEDVEELDLRGCEVVVLSACQTALGDIRHSQGVFGLQRAFHLAGTPTVVSSLWSVSDAATVELMEEFYRRLWGKEKVSKLEALRQAQLTLLRNPDRVQKRAEVLLADAKKRGLPVDSLRGIGKKAVTLPEAGKGNARRRSPEVWWAAFVLSGDWR